MDVLDNKVWIWVIVGLGWALNAWWQRRQDRLAEEQRRRNPPPKAAAAPAATVPIGDRRYQDVQQEIRRKIAERWQAANNTRPVAPPTVAPPHRPAPPPAPAARKVVEVQEVEPAFASAPSPLWGTLSASAATMPQTSASAYSGLPLATDAIPGAILLAKLADPSVARQAFLFREIFDRPICLRSAGCGGHENWN
ncbi:MAG: hypothetical protein ABSH19_00870 [Opitutales bacterium]|jgi:hypothetical protein